MPFNGSGTFNRIYSWVTDKANGIKINASRMDDEFDGLAAGLSNCITRDGQSIVTADIPFNGHRLTGVGTPSVGTDAATKAYADGTSSQAVSGWIKLPSGLILQWGTTAANTNGGGGGAIVLPTTFPGAIFTVTLTNGDYNAAAFTPQVILSQMGRSSIGFAGAPASTTVRVNWFAMGN